jgi:hypothetical protein
MTKEQQTALDQLEAVYKHITVQILTNSVQPGTPEWGAFQTLLARQSLVQSQIDAIIAEQFAAVPSAALSAAVEQLQQSTDQLSTLGTALADVNAVLGIVNTVVQIGVSVIALAASA